MPEIVLTGLAANDPVPGEYAEVVLGAGPVSAASGVRKVLLICGKLSTGSATADTTVYGPDTAIAITSEADVIALAGAGSEGHRMWRRFTAINLVTPLYMIFVAEGNTPVAATGTITVATTATGAGTLRIWVGDEFVDTGFSTGDNVTTIATAAKANINSKTWWPVTADNSAGVITLTAKQGGLRGNWIRYFAQIKPSTSGTTVTPTASTLTTGGSVTDSSTTALANIIAKPFYYLVSAAEDATQLGALASQVATQALPVTGIRQRVFGASADTLANAITISTGLNAARAELAWLAQSDMPPCELAAHQAAVFSLEESSARPRLNFSLYGDDAQTSANWKVRAPLSGAAPTRAQLLSAINSGLSPIGVLSAGRTHFEKRCTTRFLNGSVPDYRVRDAHKVTVSDFYADDLLAKAAATMRGKTLANDPLKNEPLPGPECVTPRVVKAAINRLTKDYAENGLLQNVTAILAGTQVQRSSTPTRITSLIPLQPIDILDQNAFSVQQVA